MGEERLYLERKRIQESIDYFIANQSVNRIN